MKVVFATLIILLFSCKTGTVSKPFTPNRDTDIVVAVFKIKGQWKMDSAFRIIKDTLKPGVFDSANGTAKLEQMKDTVYYVPIVTDTLKREVKFVGVSPMGVREVQNLKPI